MWEQLLNKQKVMRREGVGTIVLSARRWSPASVQSVRFVPEGRRSGMLVPEALWQDVLAAGSSMEVMALLRAADAQE